MQPRVINWFLSITPLFMYTAVDQYMELYIEAAQISNMSAYYYPTKISPPLLYRNFAAKPIPSSCRVGNVHPATTINCRQHRIVLSVVVVRRDRLFFIQRFSTFPLVSDRAFRGHGIGSPTPELYLSYSSVVIPPVVTIS